MVHHVLLRPLPVPEPERILLMSNQYPGAGASDSSNSGVPDYYDRLRETSVYDEQALFNTGSVSLDEDGRPVRVEVMNVTPSYLRVMRTPPALGRPFTNEEGEPGNEKKVLLSDGLWRSLFAADPGAVGKDLRIDGQPYTVVGVMPRGFEALAPGVSLWRPLAFTAEEKSDERRHSNNWWNVGRLKPGATLAAGAGAGRRAQRREPRALPAVQGAAGQRRLPHRRSTASRTTWSATSSRSCTCSGAARSSCC